MQTLTPIDAERGALLAFRLLVLLSILFYGWWYVSPYLPFDHSEEVRQLLEMNGFGASPAVQHPVFYLGVPLVKLIGSLGLLWLLRWGRFLFLGAALISIAAVPVSGVSVAVGLDGVIGALTGLTDGAVIAMSFLPPIANRFRIK